MAIQKHEQRVLDQKAELEGRIERLDNFLATDEYMQLDDENQALLAEQLDVMGEYVEILSRRINLFNE